MSGQVVKMSKAPRKTERVVLTPEQAMELLDRNKLNRPISQPHVQRIARQIMGGKWKYNGEAIKLSVVGDVLDGQHRLWACIEAKMAIETLIVYDVEPDAFATIDTLCKPRSGADVLSLHGVAVHRKTIAGALTWLLRWQRGVLLDFRVPSNRIENSDIEEAWAVHPEMMRAAEWGDKLRGLVSPSLITFVYYVFASHNPELADRMMSTLENPSGVGISDPFFRFRTYLTGAKSTGYASGARDPLLTIALAIKAANAAYEGKTLSGLTWRRSGKHCEEFPKLKIGTASRLIRAGKDVPERVKK